MNVVMKIIEELNLKLVLLWSMDLILYILGIIAVIVFVFCSICDSHDSTTIDSNN